jgi:glycosyltransferase involved in cell wall biosynthesis
MTRVLYLTEEPIRFTEPMVRGGAIHVRNVVEGLRARGHEVALVDWNDSPDRPYQHSVSPRSRFVDGAVRTAIRATAVGRRRQVQVVVSKTRKTYLPGLLAARRLGVPHVAHVGSSLESRSGLANQLSGRSFELRLRAPHDAYFVVCDAIADELRARNVRGDIYDVKNAVDTDRFDTEPTDTESVARFRDRHAETVGESDLTLGFVGGIHDYKGVFDLADAMAASDHDVSLLVAGDGPAREDLAARLGDTATFLGAVPYDDIPAVYHAVDGFVLPSHTEGLPRVVLEAQATATPVVATRVGGVPEVVEDGETGLLCDAHDPASLRQAIDRFAADPELRASLGSTGRAAVEESYSWDALYDRYERFLADVVGDGGQGGSRQGGEG